MKVFIGGSISIKYLNQLVNEALNKFIVNGFEILVGDAYGVDSLVQKYCFDKGYKNVTIYTCNYQPRNNLGNFKTQRISAKGLFGREFYTQKDIAMSNDCDYAFMIWDGYSKGTLNNINRLSKLGKKIDVYTSTERKIKEYKK